MKKVLVLAGTMSQFEFWARDFARDNPIVRQNRARREFETSDTHYQAATEFRHTEGHCCTEVIKVGTYKHRFHPEEIRMIDACAEIAQQQAIANAD